MRVSSYGGEEIMAGGRACQRAALQQKRSDVVISAYSGEVATGSPPRICANKSKVRACSEREHALTVLARHPQYVVRPFAIEKTAGDEQEIGQPVDVFQCRGGNLLAGLVGELDHQPLAAPAHRAGEVQIGGGRRAARQHEGAERRKVGVERV